MIVQFTVVLLLLLSVTALELPKVRTPANTRLRNNGKICLPQPPQEYYIEVPTPKATAKPVQFGSSFHQFTTINSASHVHYRGDPVASDEGGKNEFEPEFMVKTQFSFPGGELFQGQAQGASLSNYQAPSSIPVIDMCSTMLSPLVFSSAPISSLSLPLLLVIVIVVAF